MSYKIKIDEVNNTAQNANGGSHLPSNESNAYGKQDVVELTDESFSKLIPNLGVAANWLGAQISEMEQSGRIDSRSGEILRYALGASFNGERSLIPMLIDENHAARILGMEAKEFRKSKYLRNFRYCNAFYYFNTEIYELLDRKEHCPRRAANNPACKNKKDRSSVRARKSFTDAIISGTAHEVTAKETKCMSVHYLVHEFVKQGQYSTESHIKPRDIYDILKTYTIGRDPLAENLAFICAKLGCQNVADLAYLLEATEDEIQELLGKTKLNVGNLVRYWEDL